MGISETVSGEKLESGFEDRPDHRISLGPAPRPMVVEAFGQKLVETDRAVLLKEADYPPVRYYRRSDIDMSALIATDHTSWCPFKGRASYFTIKTADGELENAAWSYEDPFQEVAEVKDLVSFYTDKPQLTQVER